MTDKSKVVAPVPSSPKVEAASGPARFKEGETRDWQQLRVVDAKTGRTIPHVVAADASAGKVTVRKVESGSFVIENGDFALETVDRAIRIERTDKATA